MKSKTTAVWIVMLLAVAGVAGIAAYVTHTPRLVPPVSGEPNEPSLNHAKTSAQPPARHGATIIVFTPSMGADGISFSRAMAEVPEGEDAKVFAVNAFLKAAQIAPPDARALGVEMRDDGTAAIGFNQAFARSYGSFEEKSLLDGFAATLGQFAEVKTIRLEVEGRPITSLGSTDLSAAIPVMRPDAVPSKPTDQNPPPDEPSNQPGG